jgi:hypothetical protein
MARESYVVHKIKKRFGGVRIIHEPPELLKYVQKRILFAIFYPMFRNNCIDENMFGFLPGRSIADNAYEHTKQPWNFLYKLDLKDAFPSVRNIDLSIALRTIMLSKTQEIVDKFNKFEERHAELIASREDRPVHRLFKREPHSDTYKVHTFSFKTILGRNSETSWFRELLLGTKEEYLRAQVLMVEVSSMIADLCTSPSGFLPQGAPTSGFALNAVATHIGILNVLRNQLYFIGCKFQHQASMYADDIAFSTMKKISWESMQRIIASIESLGVWKINPDKIYEYDRRSTGPIVCGMRIGRYRIHSKDQCDFLYQYSGTNHKHLVQKIKNGENWSIDFITIPKKLKKKIRALEYKLKMDPDNKALRKVVLGYRGYMIDIIRKSRMPKGVFAGRKW